MQSPSVRFRRKTGWNCDGGEDAGPPGRNARCRKTPIRMARSLRAPSGTLQGTTRGSQGTPPLDSTCIGPRFASPPRTGGVSTPRKRATASLGAVRNGRCIRRFCRRSCRGRPAGEGAGGWPGIHWPMGDVGKQRRNSSRPRMWEGRYLLCKSATPELTC